MNIQVKKDVVLDLPMSYAVNFLHTPAGKLCICASEGLGGCYIFPADTMAPAKQIWKNAGGCMSISQIAPDGTFLAVQNFFKGFNAKLGCIVKTSPQAGGEWKTEPFMDMPYLHRFDVIEVEGVQFLIACTLCKSKEYRLDWSEPGSVYIGKLEDGGLPPKQIRKLIPSLTKNHGFYRGYHKGKEILLISGMEGLYEVQIPEHANGEWKTVCLMDREISDATVVDIDGDGVEEIITIEGFHGDHIAINKATEDGWEDVYRFPAPFAHAVWGGQILGEPGLVLAYRNDNGALMLLRKSKKEGAYYMDHLLIDELVSPTNLAIESSRDIFRIFASCGKTQQIVVYTLTK